MDIQKHLAGGLAGLVIGIAGGGAGVWYGMHQTNKELEQYVQQEVVTAVNEGLSEYATRYIEEKITHSEDVRLLDYALSENQSVLAYELTQELLYDHLSGLIDKKNLLHELKEEEIFLVTPEVEQKLDDQIRKLGKYLNFTLD